MAFESLEPELAAHLTAICKAQMSGEYDPRMVYQPGKGLRANSRLGKGEEVISTDIDRNDLRALATHDYLSLATPRAHWFVTATAKALTEYADD
ncbi:MAG: hypothetical protein AAF333_16245 [Planctomycetota bacterium]